MASIKLSLLATLSILCFAFIPKKDITGLYVSGCDKKINNCSQIHLKPDHTYEFATFNPPNGWKYTKGSWMNNGDTITFTFKTPPEQLNIQSRDNTIIGNRIQLNLLDTTNIKAVLVRINDGEFIDTVSSMSSINLPTSINIKKIAISAIGNDTISLKFQAYSHCNYFLIRTLNLNNYDNSNETIITNEEWLLVGNKLHPKSKAHDGFSEFYFKKSNIKNKAFIYGK